MENPLFLSSLGLAWRPPDFRWRCAVWISDSVAALCPHPDDQRIGDAVLFLWAKKASDAAPGATLFQRGWAALHEALQIYSPPATFLRWELEARLLTGQTSEAIGRACSCTPEVVEAYHDFFFDVRDRLHNRSFITHRVIGSKQQTGLTADDRDMLLKIFAYHRGAKVLDLVVEDLRAGPPAVPRRLSSLSPAQLDDLELRLAVHRAVLALTTPADQKNIVALTRLEALSRLDEARERAGDPAFELPAPDCPESKGFSPLTEAQTSAETQVPSRSESPSPRPKGKRKRRRKSA